ncbi:hypothetical protein J6590_019381 [Homalodisca vitripennis]|nr:hypothetical protein J6590_019381 [Homalodisca vitripennis]
MDHIEVTTRAEKVFPPRDPGSAVRLCSFQAFPGSAPKGQPDFVTPCPSGVIRPTTGVDCDDLPAACIVQCAGHVSIVPSR